MAVYEAVSGLPGEGRVQQLQVTVDDGAALKPLQMVVGQVIVMVLKSRTSCQHHNTTALPHLFYKSQPNISQALSHLNTWLPMEYK